MGPARLEDWDARMAEVIEAARYRSFAWGSHDCTTWAMAVRSAITQADGAPWGGKYKTARGALRQLRKMGFRSLEAAGRGVLGDPIDPRMAQRGDICLCGNPAPDQAWPDVFSVCAGRNLLVVAEDGLTALPLTAAKMAWRV